MIGPSVTYQDDLAVDKVFYEVVLTLYALPVQVIHDISHSAQCPSQRICRLALKLFQGIRCGILPLRI